VERCKCQQARYWSKILADRQEITGETRLAGRTGWTVDRAGKDRYGRETEVVAGVKQYDRFAK
jgi:hypothetical protein